jgi:hypothetical protein
MRNSRKETIRDSAKLNQSLSKGAGAQHAIRTIKNRSEGFTIGWVERHELCSTMTACWDPIRQEAFAGNDVGLVSQLAEST